MWKPFETIALAFATQNPMLIPATPHAEPCCATHPHTLYASAVAVTYQYLLTYTYTSSELGTVKQLDTALFCLITKLNSSSLGTELTMRLP